MIKTLNNKKHQPIEKSCITFIPCIKPFMRKVSLGNVSLST